MAWTKVVTESSAGKIAQESATATSIGNLTSEVTSVNRATTITDNVVDEANLKVSNAPTNGQFLSAQSGNTGGMTWAAVPSGNVSTALSQGTTSATVYNINSDGSSPDLAIPAATSTQAGVLSSQVLAAIGDNTAKDTNVSTNLDITGTTGARVITSSDGDDATIPVATTLVSGVMSTGIFDAVGLNTAKATNIAYPAETKSTINALDITEVGIIGSGEWRGTAVDQTYLSGQSGTNTGDETITSINALAITTVGNISSGEWNGTKIPITLGGSGAAAKTGTGNNVLSASPTFTGTIGAASLTLSGDLTVSGTTTTISTNELIIEDNLITLNSNATGTPTPDVDAGIEIERGTRTNTSIMWDEGENYWTQRVQLSSSNDTVGITAMIPMVESATTGTGGNSVASGNFFVNTATNSLYVNV